MTSEGDSAQVVGGKGSRVWRSLAGLFGCRKADGTTDDGDGSTPSGKPKKGLSKLGSKSKQGGDVQHRSEEDLLFGKQWFGYSRTLSKRGKKVTNLDAVGEVQATDNNVLKAKIGVKQKQKRPPTTGHMKRMISADVFDSTIRNEAGKEEKIVPIPEANSVNHEEQGGAVEQKPTPARDEEANAADKENDIESQSKPSTQLPHGENKEEDDKEEKNTEDGKENKAQSDGNEASNEAEQKEPNKEPSEDREEDVSIGGTLEREESMKKTTETAETSNMVTDSEVILTPTAGTKDLEQISSTVPESSRNEVAAAEVVTLIDETLVKEGETNKMPPPNVVPESLAEATLSTEMAVIPVSEDAERLSLGGAGASTEASSDTDLKNTDMDSESPLSEVMQTIETEIEIKQVKETEENSSGMNGIPSINDKDLTCKQETEPGKQDDLDSSGENDGQKSSSTKKGDQIERPTELTTCSPNSEGSAPTTGGSKDKEGILNGDSPPQANAESSESCSTSVENRSSADD